MKINARLLVVSLFLFLMVSGSSAQISFEAKFDAPQAVLGSTVELRFSLKNANATQFRPPVFQDFRIIGGPNQENSMSIINSQITRSAAWVFLLIPTREGLLKVGEATILVDGKKIKSTPISLEVVKSRSQLGGRNMPKNSAPPDDVKREVFITSNPSASEIWLGQQMTLEYLLFTRRDLSGIEVNYEPKYAGFFTQNMERFDRGDRREMVGGKPFLCKILKKTALFSQQTGDLTIESMLLQAGIIDNNNGFLGGFFNQNQSINLSTDPLKITVKPLPAPAPENFCGGVGQYKMSTTIDRSELTTDDALTVKITLEGNGDPKRISPPSINWPAELEVSAPKMTAESNVENGEFLISSQTFEYVLLPKTVGEVDFLPKTSIFDPQKGVFAEITAPPIHLNIRQGSVATTDLNNVSTEQSAEKNQRKKWFNQSVFWVLGSATMLAVLLFLLFKQKKTAPTKADEQKIDLEKKVEKATILGVSTPTINAYSAKKSLESARLALKNEQIIVFYEKISETIELLFSEKYGLEPSQFSIQNFEEKLKINKVDAATFARLARVWKACERARFAGLTDATAAGTILEDTEFLCANI